MTKQEFLRLKRRIDKLLQKAEDEALEDGVDITSKEFQSVFRELKRKILKARGISLEDYERAEQEYEESKEKRNKIEILGAERVEKLSQTRKKEIQEKIEEIKRDYSVKLNALAKESNNKIQVLIKKTNTEKKELLKEIKTLKEQRDVLNKQTKELEERFYREALRKDRELEDIKDSIKLGNEIMGNIIKFQGGLSKDVDTLKSKEIISPKLKKEMRGTIKTVKQIENYLRTPDLTPGWRERIVSDLEAKVSEKVSASAFIDDETPTGTVNGVNKTFVLANTPISGSVKVLVNGQRMKSGGEDYTISGSTITFNTAPPINSIILTDYRK